jgi:aryl-alcohol dehydrogenase-like predicted oxidoreductase
MKYAKLGWTDLQLSRIGLGTWAIGGGNWEWAWGPQDDEQSIATIHRALDVGINWIDTAPVYGLGHSEEVIGQALQGIHERPILATKCSLVWDAQKEVDSKLKRESVLREAEESLKRLKVEAIDLYQIHWPTPDEDIEEGWAAISELIQSGKIRYGGVSNFNIDQMKRLLPIHPIASLQPPYSMVRREIEDQILPFCGEKEIGVIAYSPLQKGLLTGKVTQKWVKNLPEDDHRKRDRRFQEPFLSSVIQLVNNLSDLAEKRGYRVAHLAIAWALQRPEVTAAIVGARSPAQIEETAKAGDWELNRTDLETIKSLLAEMEP